MISEVAGGCGRSSSSKGDFQYGLGQPLAAQPPEAPEPTTNIERLIF